MRCPWLLAETKVATIFGQLIFFIFLLPPLFKTTEVVDVGFKKCGAPSWPPWGDF
jgi:hypothetical protein